MNVVETGGMTRTVEVNALPHSNLMRSTVTRALVSGKSIDA